MRWFTLVALLLVTPVSAGDNPITQADDYLKKAFPADGPGAAVLIKRDGNSVLLQGYGLADVDKRTPVTPDTAFDLASVSKQFTAMATMILAERGKLNYDDAVKRWIDPLPTREGARDLTVRDLLTHVSGLPDYLGFVSASDAEFAKLTNADVAGLLTGKKLRFLPGSKFEYSNSNYALLAHIVERASGKTFAKFLEQHVFQPADMTATKVMDEVPCNIPLRANGYGKQYGILGKRIETRRDGPICGDGNVFTTVRDLAKWDDALANNRLVRPETLTAAYAKPKLADDRVSDYGFGWVIQEKDGKKTVWHNGGWAGTRTIFVRKLTDRLTVAVLCNDEAADPAKVARELAKFFD